jgi:sarcosine oxidase, subunit beta
MYLCMYVYKTFERRSDRFRVHCRRIKLSFMKKSVSAMLRRCAYRGCAHNSASTTADVVVIGAGVIGASIALQLRRRGVADRVTVLDTLSGPGDGSTSYSSGCLRTFYSIEDMIRTANEGLHIYRNWRDYVQLPAAKYDVPRCREIGAGLLYTKHSRVFLDGYLEAAGRNNVRVERLDQEATRERFGKLLGWDVDSVFSPRRIHDDEFDQPLAGERVDGSLYVPDTAYIADPRLATANLATAAVNAGAVFRYNSRVTKVLKRGGKVHGVELADGTVLSAPVVINAAGPYSSFVDKMAFEGGANPDAAGNPGNDSRVVTRALRAEVAFLPAPPGIDLDTHGVMGVDFDVGVYFRPEPGNKLLVGSLDSSCDPHEYIDDPEELAAVSQTPFGDMWTHNVLRAALRMPTLRVPNQRSAQGIVAAYDATPDWNPILDKSSLPGYFFAVGTSGNAFKIAPIIGDFIAQLVRYVECEGGDHDATPLVMRLPHTGGVFGSASTSRLRNLHTTTGTVIG